MRKELEALDCLRDILTLQPQLDFLALILPPWILHEDAYDRLFQGIYDLLASRYCIHLKKVSLASHGIPCDGTVIILLASSVSSPVQWTGLFDSKKDEAVDPIAFDRIRDLAFRNPRSSDLTAGSLVCKHPTANTNVYNHQTGIAPPDSHPVDLGSLLDMTNTARIRHPGSFYPSTLLLPSVTYSTIYPMTNESTRAQRHPHRPRTRPHPRLQRRLRLPGLNPATICRRHARVPAPSCEEAWPGYIGLDSWVSD